MASPLQFRSPAFEFCPKSFACSSTTNIFSRSSSTLYSNLGVCRKVPPAVAFAAPKFRGTQIREQKLSDMIVEKVSEAKEVCEGNERSEECKVAWDEVEEISQAKAHFRERSALHDPLESYCKDNPETDECRIYED